MRPSMPDNIAALTKKGMWTNAWDATVALCRPVAGTLLAFMTCHTVRYAADAVHVQYCSRGFFSSMLSNTSAPCYALRRLSASLTDSTAALILTVGFSGVVATMCKRTS
jgi:hypothetical protein